MSQRIKYIQVWTDLLPDAILQEYPCLNSRSNFACVNESVEMQGKCMNTTMYQVLNYSQSSYTAIDANTKTKQVTTHIWVS